jgi:cytochrome P450 family 3 subfamily A
MVIDVNNSKKNCLSLHQDFLDMMLSNTQNQDLPENKKLSENEVIAQSFAFLVAGYDTTSNALALICHHLATSPDVQERLQKEIDEVWSDEDQPPSYEVVHSLPYLDMVISEILRLYPPGT